MFLREAIRACALFASLALSAFIPQQQRPLRPLDGDGDVVQLPLVIWHGLGDNYEAEGLRSVARLAEEVNPGTFVYLIRLHEDATADRDASFFGNLTVQLDKVCADLASHPVLSAAPAVNALGFSQGGQFMRAYVERCNAPPVASLVTFGAQHSGIAEFQACAPADWACRAWQRVLRGSTWGRLAQSRLVPAQYFRDPADLPAYLAHSNFLADVNNERPAARNATYAANIRRLRRFVMYLFRDDRTVVPRVSGWFGDFNRSAAADVPLRDRALYREDWLGLRWLDERGRLVFAEVDGAHMALTDAVLNTTFSRYFGPVAADPSDEIADEL